MHKSFLCNASPFFRAALEGGFKESEDGGVSLPEESAETFERFLGWLYGGEYNIEHLKEGKKASKYWGAVINDHVFADKIQVEAFQKHIIERAIEGFHQSRSTTISLELVRELYTKTQVASPLRRLAVAMWECVPPHLIQKQSVVDALVDNPEFATDLVQRLAGRLQPRRLLESLTAEELYHESANGVTTASRK